MPYILLFIVGSNIAPERYESLVSIQQEYSSKQACEIALAGMLRQVYKKADVIVAQCTAKNA